MASGASNIKGLNINNTENTFLICLLTKKNSQVDENVINIKIETSCSRTVKEHQTQVV